MFLILIFSCGCVSQEEFMLTDIIFCESQPADRAYEQKQDPTYVQGETVWIYLEAFKFDYTEEAYLYVVSFDVTLELFDEQGSFIRGGTERMEESSSEVPVYWWFRFWMDSGDLEEGAYIVRITMTDTLSGESATTENTFYITGTSASLLLYSCKR